MHRRRVIQQLSASLGITLMPGTISAMLSGCRPNPNNPFAVLSVTEAARRDGIAEMLIPETDTPGAVEAGATAWVDMMLSVFSNADTRVRIRNQLSVLQEWIHQQGQKDFSSVPVNDKSELMHALDCQAFPDAYPNSASNVAGLPKGNPPLLRTLKPWIVAAYYTSEIGATIELHESPFGSYKGDIPLTDVGRTWA